MAPKRKDASSHTSPATVSASANAASIKPSTAASSTSSTSSPLKTSKSGGSGITFGHSSNTPYTPPSSSSNINTGGAGSSSTSAKTTTSTTTTTTTTTSGGKGAGQAQDAQAIVKGVWDRYVRETPQRVKLVDAFMAFLVALGGVQFVYCVVAGNYPFNAFLSGFSATVGQFVLTASLRIQTNVANAAEFPAGFSDERAFADFVVGSLLLHFFCVNFIN